MAISEFSLFKQCRISMDNNFDQPRKSVLDVLQICMEKIEKDFPGKSRLAKIVLAARAILEIEGITLPLMLVILGPPGSAKTTMLRMIGLLPDSFSADSFTQNSFVSHYAAKKKEHLDKDDLLAQIKDKAFLVFDLAPMFTSNEESLVQTVGILTSVLDGRGYKKISGVHGMREHGPTFFVLIGAAVYIPKNIWAMIAQLGPKMFFYQMDMQMSYEEEHKKILDNMSNDSKEYEQKIQEIGKYLNEFWTAMRSVLAPNGGKIVWDAARDDPKVVRRIIECAQLLARLRGYVPTDKTEGTGGSNYGYTNPIVEDPERAARHLLNVAKGSAVCQVRNYLTADDLPVVMDLMLSSASKERIDLLKLLIRKNGQVTTDEFLEERGGTRTTALKTMKQLVILGLVDEVMVPATTKHCKAIRLKEQFRWILEVMKE